MGLSKSHVNVGQHRFGTIFGVFGAPPILEPILVGIGMFSGGTGFGPMPISHWLNSVRY